MARFLKTLFGSLIGAAFVFIALPVAQEPAVAAVNPYPGRPLKVWVATASWYGQDFQGKPTASGELYDMNADTAADPSLPFGSIVRLKNLRTGKTQLARINDRGPHVDGRDMDVSYSVARKLGIVGRGVTRLRIELVEVPKRPQ